MVERDDRRLGCMMCWRHSLGKFSEDCSLFEQQSAKLSHMNTTLFLKI